MNWIPEASSFIVSAMAGVLYWERGPSGPEMASQIFLLALLTVLLFFFARKKIWSAYFLLLVTLLGYSLYLWIKPPLPSSLVWMYSALTTLAAFLYVSVNEKELQNFKKGFQSAVTENHPARRILFLIFPFWVATAVFARTSKQIDPPLSLRIIHPEPPSQIEITPPPTGEAYSAPRGRSAGGGVKGKSMDLAALENPFRKLEKEDPQQFLESVLQGKHLYYKNCFFCHGDNLEGKGHFANAFNPLPANFQDVGTIAMLQESFVFWRVAKGGPGLPDSSHPWSSAMPQWENMLSEDEMWKVLLYIYNATGHAPRTWELASEKK
ncbi:MAG: c-type cytochrome [Elusimicrobia bacterium]|nr:c-type cytochrome [Elusimicrobiota bacterium]